MKVQQDLIIGAPAFLVYNYAKNSVSKNQLYSPFVFCDAPRRILSSFSLSLSLSLSLSPSLSLFLSPP